MCFRLLAAAVRAVFPAPDGGAGDIAVLERLAFEAGLDVRFAESGGLRFVEIALGDCACSLYTGEDGRARVTAFVSALLAAGERVQLLLFHDGDTIDWRAAEPVPLSRDAFRRAGLAALPEGRVVEIL